MDGQFNPYFPEDGEWTRSSANPTSTAPVTSSYPYVPLDNSSRYGDALLYTHSLNSQEHGSSLGNIRAANDRNNSNSSPSSTSSRVLHGSVQQPPDRDDANHPRPETRRRPRISPNKWEEIRPAFTELYIGQYKTLAETMKILSERYGFTASEKLFKDKIRAWGLTKNTRQNLDGSDREREGGRRRENGTRNVQNPSISNINRGDMVQPHAGAVRTRRTSYSLHHGHISPDSMLQSPEMSCVGSTTGPRCQSVQSDMEAARLQQELLELTAQQGVIRERLRQHQQRRANTGSLDESVEDCNSHLQTVSDSDGIVSHGEFFGAEQQINNRVTPHSEQHWLSPRNDYRHVLPDTSKRAIDHSDDFLHHAGFGERGFPDRTPRHARGSVPRGIIPDPNLQLDNVVTNPLPNPQIAPRRQHRR